MSATQLWIIGAVCAVIAIIWIGDIFFSAPEEDFDEDLADQETQAQEVVDSMKGELDYMRRDGLL